MLLDRLGELDEAGDPAAARPGQPGVEQPDRRGRVGFQEDDAQLLLQEISAVEAAVDRGDRGELRLLAFAQPLGPLPERPARALQPARPGLVARPAGLVPDLAPHLVERVTGQGDDEAERRLRALLAHGAGDPLAHIAGDELELRFPLAAQLLEEAGDRLLVAPVGRPDQSAAVVVDDTGDVALALAIGELVDPDPAQPLQPVTAPRLLVSDHPLNDPAHRQPGEPHQLADRALRALRRQPRHLLLELARKPGALPRPGHPRDHDPVAPALDPRRLRLHERLRRPDVERPPTPSALAAVILIGYANSRQMC